MSVLSPSGPLSRLSLRLASLSLLLLSLHSNTVDALQCIEHTQTAVSVNQLELTNFTTMNIEDRDDKQSKARCVLFRGTNSSHWVQIRLGWPSTALPSECHTRELYCFPWSVGVPFPLHGCCCATDNCNKELELLAIRHPIAIDTNLIAKIIRKSKILLSFVAHISIPAFLLIIWTLIEEKLIRGSKYEAVSSGSEESLYLPKPEITSSKVSKKGTVGSVMDVVVDPCENPTQKSLRTVRTQVVQERTGREKTRREKVMPRTAVLQSLASAESETPLVGCTQDDTVCTSRTQSLASDRPTSRVLPNGRRQRVSMNYENSTYSDLE